MTLKMAMQISNALNLSDAETNSITLSVLHASSKTSKISKKVRLKLEAALAKNGLAATPLYTTLEIERFKAMSTWYHLAILNLATLDSFQNNPIWIGRQLGISTIEAQDGLERLLSIGLLQETDNKITRTIKSLYVKTHRSEFAIRKFHEQMITKAKEELIQLPTSIFKIG